MHGKSSKTVPLNVNPTTSTASRLYHTHRNNVIHLGANVIMMMLLLIPVVKLGFDFFPTQSFTRKTQIFTLDDRDVILMIYLPCENKKLETVVRQYDRYWLFENYFIGIRTKELNCSSAITYCTHGRDVNFFTQLPTVVGKWNAPVSVALYATGTDFVEMLNAIKYVRHCLYESYMIRDWVSFHIVMPLAHMTTMQPLAARDLPFMCNQSAAQYQNWNYTSSYAYRMNLPYPVNVLMNVARRAANTYYFMHADIELVPIASYVWSHFLDTIKNAICLHYENDGGTVVTCMHLAGRDKVLKRLHMLPAWHIPEKHVFQLHKFRLKPDTIIPQKMQEFHLIYKEGRAQLLRTIDPTFIGNPMVPYYDERIYWHTNDRYRHMLTYAICLLQTQYLSTDDLFLAFYDENNNTMYRNKEIFIKEAAHLNSTVLQREYGNLYGADRMDDCRMCFYRFKICS